MSESDKVRGNDNNEGRFSKFIVDSLCKRAASHCSNPECKAVTTGPADDASKAIVIGEAAHILGANPGSARYEASMLPAARAEITNGIWLCRNCHKMIDADADRFPPPLLYTWRADHEKYMSSQLGKTNEILRRQIVEAQIKHLGDIGDVAEQILIDKPPAWEFLLTAEILRYKCRFTTRRWDSLKKKLYAKPSTRIESEQAFLWFSDRLAELPTYIQAAMGICNTEFATAWGAPGVPGSAELIVETCSLFAETCQNMLRWEETIRFTKLPPEYDEVMIILRGSGGRALEQISVLPEEIAKIFPLSDTPKDYKISIVVDLPSEWENQMEDAVERLAIKLCSQ